MKTKKMTEIPVDNVSLNTHTPGENSFEFTIDCGGVYFGAVYDRAGHLEYIDQYFYTPNASHSDLTSAIAYGDEVLVDEDDFPTKTYLLTKEEAGHEWMRFHAVVPDQIDTNYFAHKYINETE
jgi:hypothetical protein